jgi:hypothetical protein
MQFVEAVVVQVIEKLPRTDSGVSHLEVMNPLVPVALNGLDHQRSSASDRTCI